ncbi:MAG: NAD(P)/FAD-dependent oxidoreductase [Nocardiopsaceae bacterium]|nr:NAD(P)/FAD-dependent oxidoreductase [Nocardiopsaceae bacterium]
MARQVYDVVVLGAGPTGENVADRAVRGGLSAAIVEPELVGGECSYWACMPSKALLRPVAAASEAGHLLGVAGTRLDAADVLKRRDSFASHWEDDGQVQWLEHAKIALYRGHGRLAGERRVTVSPAGVPSAGTADENDADGNDADGNDDAGTELIARHAVVIATGSSAVIPPPLKDVNPWTSRDATSAHAAPGRLAIVGGGVAGCEMAAAWQALGAQVTLIARGGLLERLPEFAGDLVAAGLRDAGADVRCGTSVTEAGRNCTGPVTLTLDDGTRVEADEVLAATGRAPRTAGIGLETAGLEPGSWLSVDDTLRVIGGNDNRSSRTDGGDSPVPWLYACGDVNHLALLTHMGKYQARICGDAIVARASGREPAVTDRSSKACVPQVIFTVPEVAAAGLTEGRAREAGIRTRVVTLDLGNVAGAALFADGYTGTAQMVVDEDRKVIVGMTLAGPGVGELIHAATVAIAGQVPLEALWHAVPSYPTISELWLRLLEAYGL